jgi:hypothetical protein
MTPEQIEIIKKARVECIKGMGATAAATLYALLLDAKPKQEHGEPSCPKCVFGVCHCKQDKVFVEGYGENSHSFVSITKQEPDYKALWKQMCERCDWLDRNLAIYSEQEPIGEAYLCNACQTPFDGAYKCPSCGHHTSTKTPVYIQPSDMSC